MSEAATKGLPCAVDVLKRHLRRIATARDAAVSQEVEARSALGAAVVDINRLDIETEETRLAIEQLGGDPDALLERPNAGELA